MLEERKPKKYNTQDKNMTEYVIPKWLKHVIDAIGIQEEKTVQVVK